MSKITFRADDDLVAQLEEFEASKSEVMREALRTYLETEPEGGGRDPDRAGESAEEDFEALIAERVDAALEERLADVSPGPQDVNVNIAVEDPMGSDTPTPESRGEATRPVSEEVESERTCSQCGETVAAEHVYCPNCGEKASHRVFCECGDELRSDWAFCPSCGRRTPAADVLDQ